MTTIRVSAEERQRIIDEFYDTVFGGLEMDQAFVTRMRSVRPELPDDPAPEQVDAWIELAELLADPAYRARIRRMAEQHAEDRAGGNVVPSGDQAGTLAATIADRAGAALATGTSPTSPEARTIVDAIMTEQAALHGRPDDEAFRRSFVDRVAINVDAAAERQWELLGVINGWPPFPRAVPAWDWFFSAVRASLG